MRNAIKVCLIALTITIGLGNAKAQGIPPGTYQQTCVNIQMQNWTLYANCQDVDGRWRTTSLPDMRSCVGDVTNVNGELRCNRGEAWRAPNNLPRGSYLQTCRGARIRGDRLNAKCEAVSGAWVRTSLDDVQRCVGDIVNDDGQLQCSRQALQAAGPYVQTCSPVYVRGDDLRARCQGRDGRWVWTSLDHYQDCHAPIVNWDGQLRCGGGDHDRDRDRDRGNDDADRDRDRDRGQGPNLPPGSYAQTCRDIQIRGDHLLATCQDREGNWRSSDLDDFQRCRQGIVNLDGRLTCAQ